MSLPASAQESWSGLAEPWREALELAWASFRGGGIAVGAVLTDRDGLIVGRGRNRRFGQAGTEQGLLAHAEMQALAALPPGKQRARDAELYTTLSPCPMCLGAVVVARVGTVHVGAEDPTWLGIEGLAKLNSEVRRRWPQTSGPLSGPLGEFAAILPCLNTSGSLVRAMEAVAPERAELARAAALRLAKLDEPAETVERAIEQLWDMLAEHR